MSEMTTPSKFIAAMTLCLFAGTAVTTVASKSFIAFVVGLCLTLGLARAMIGIGRK